mmetsp:Transcript_17956/g.16235  ORF Transcript_17956/g.16235 Transcript_17956/m.16235 type:complete len:332 (-) Transcript_17956:246-1241(-)
MASTITSTNRLHFPAKIYLILENESPDIIRWHPNCKAFRITDHTRFEREIIPKYFRHNQMASVQRQLNLYGFKCVSRGEDKGSFYHPKFQRGDWESAKSIRRCISHSQFGIQNWKLPEDNKVKFNEHSTRPEGTFDMDSLCDTDALAIRSQTTEIKKETPIVSTINQTPVTSVLRKVDWHWPPAPVVAQQRQVQNIISAFASNDLTAFLDTPLAESNIINNISMHAPSVRQSVNPLKISAVNVSKPSFKWYSQFHLDSQSMNQLSNVNTLVEKESNVKNYSYNNNDYNYANINKSTIDNSIDCFDDLMFMCADLDNFLGDCSDQTLGNPLV